MKKAKFKFNPVLFLVLSIPGFGISKEGDLLDLALKADIVKKTGAWYSFDGDKIGQGRENVKLNLKDNEKLYQNIESQVKTFLGSDEK